MVEPCLSQLSANLCHQRKLTRINPPNLSPAGVPNRIVDYGIMLQRDDALDTAFRTTLRPAPGTIIKSWNHFTTSQGRHFPLAISIETKSPDKSWTDGKPQLGIWTSAS